MRTIDGILAMIGLFTVLFGSVYLVQRFWVPVTNWLFPPLKRRRERRAAEARWWWGYYVEEMFGPELSPE
jgi:hypothetical protein